jgi:hypothetical protein
MFHGDYSIGDLDADVAFRVEGFGYGDYLSAAGNVRFV